MTRDLILYYSAGVVAVFVSSIAVYMLALRYKWRLGVRLLCFCMLLASYMVVAQVLKFRSLHFYVDFSHWIQILYNIAFEGKAISRNVEMAVPGTLNYLSVHFVPYLYILAVPFRVWPYGETLIVMNFLIAASTIIPIYKLAKHYQHNAVYGMFVAVLLLWYPTFQYLTLYEFDMLRLSIPLFLWMIFFWEARRLILYFLFAILAVFVREEVGLTVAMFGVYLAIFERPRAVGIATVLLGGGAFVLITQFVMPELRAAGEYSHIAMTSFAELGTSIGEILLNSIKNPLLVMKVIFEPIKLANIFMLFLPLLFIPFFALPVLIATLANIGVGMLSGSQTHLSYMLFYVSQSVPFIFYAFIKGWSRFVVVLSRYAGRGRAVGDVGSAAMVAVAAGMLVVNVFFGPSPLSLQFWFRSMRPAPFNTQDFHHSVYRVNEHHRVAERITASIPSNSVVSAQHYLHSLLFTKRATLIFPQLTSADRKTEVDYVLVDTSSNGLRAESPAYLRRESLAKIKSDGEKWVLVTSEDDFYLYKNARRDHFDVAE